MSIKSPIYDEIGNDLDEETTKTFHELRQRSQQRSAGQNTSSEEVAMTMREYFANHSTEKLSLNGLYSFGAAQSRANDNEFQSDVVNYVKDWEKVITERVELELKHVKELEATKRHYEQKVEGLREKFNQKEGKGKSTSQGNVEKLDRNEDKLKDAFSVYEREAGKLCTLLEAATHEGYKDLYPLVKNYLEWEINRNSREHEIAERMRGILDCLNEKMGSQIQSPGNATVAVSDNLECNTSEQ